MVDTLLPCLDKFNQLAPGLDREDREDLAWPGLLVGLQFRGIPLSKNLSTQTGSTPMCLLADYRYYGLKINSRKRKESNSYSDQSKLPKLPTKEQLLDNAESDEVRPFLRALADFKSHDPQVVTFLSFVYRYCKHHHLITPLEFPPEHPVEEVARLLMVVQIRHHDLGHVALSIVEYGLSESGNKFGLPRTIAAW